MKRLILSISIKPLHVQNECLNRIIKISINGIDGYFKTPKLHKGWLTDSKDSLRSVNESIGEKHWGMILSRPTGDAVIEKICITLLLRKIDTSKLSNIQKEISVWLEKLEENLSCLGHDYNGEFLTIVTSKNCSFYEESRKNIKRIPLSSSHITINTYKDYKYLSYSTLKKGLVETSRNAQPLLEIRLIKEAKYALRQLDTRKAILDCATAIEIILTGLMKQKLKIKNQKILSNILKKFNGIASKKNFLKDAGIKIPQEKDYQIYIEDLRNQAIHSGKKPEYKDSKRAILISEKLIETFYKGKFERVI